MEQASSQKQVKSVLGEPKVPGSFLQVRTISLNCKKSRMWPDRSERSTVEGACRACSQPLYDNGRRLRVHPPRSIVSLCVALPAISWQISTLHKCYVYGEDTRVTDMSVQTTTDDLCYTGTRVETRIWHPPLRFLCVLQSFHANLWIMSPPSSGFMKATHDTLKQIMDHFLSRLPRFTIIITPSFHTINDLCSC
jgi:hypothetical protein